MTNRRQAGIFCILLALSCSLPLRLASAEEGLAADKIRSAEPEAPKPLVDEVRKIDLARDFANKLVRPEGMEFKPYSLEQARKIDYFLVFFGAHWCPNCKKFTPKLAEFYRGQQRPGQQRNFEVIFVSADKDEKAMLQYMNGYQMPWPALKFGEQKKLASVKAIAGRGYPCVALVDARDGEILAHSYGEDRKGDYVGPLKPVEKLKEILDKSEPRPKTKSLARVRG